MTPDFPWSLAAPLLLAGIGFIVWLVRLEGRVNAKADATEVVKLGGRVDGLEEKARQHGDLRDLVIRLDTRMENVEKALVDLAQSMRPTRRRAGE